MRAGWALGAAAAAMVLALAGPGVLASGGGRAVASTHATPGQALSALINARLRAGGSWFSAKEQAVIVAKCGYSPGEWDGFEADMEGEIFRCANGRRVDDPEMRAVMESARPRIERRVEAVMASAEVRDAIGRVARDAAAEAMARMDMRRR